MKNVDEIAFYFPFQRRRRRCCDLHLFGSCIAFFPLLKMTKKMSMIFCIGTFYQSLFLTGIFIHFQIFDLFLAKKQWSPCLTLKI